MRRSAKGWQKSAAMPGTVPLFSDTIGSESIRRRFEDIVCKRSFTIRGRSFCTLSLPDEAAEASSDANASLRTGPQSTNLGNAHLAQHHIAGQKRVCRLE